MERRKALHASLSLRARAADQGSGCPRMRCRPRGKTLVCIIASQLRGWVKALADDPQHAFAGQGQDEAEQLEIAQLKREDDQAEGRTEHILEKAAAYFLRRNRREVRFYREAPGDLAGGMVVRGARCLAGWVLCLADTTAQSAQPKR